MISNCEDYRFKWQLIRQIIQLITNVIVIVIRMLLLLLFLVNIKNLKVWEKIGKHFI